MLVLGDEIVARYAAINLMGQSEFSESSAGQVSFAQVQTVPSMPSGVATEGALTMTDQIHIMIEPVTGVASGGSSILSYQIDMSTDEIEWTELKGYSTNDDSLEWIETGLTISVVYKLRYRARNIYGWGYFSEISEIRSTMVPAQISIPSAELSTTNIEISWTEPDSRGDAIQYYVVQILNSENVFTEHSLYCHEITTLSCLMPMETLIDPTDIFKLSLGSMVQARVTSLNAKGLGDFSEANTEGALVQAIPDSPTQVCLKVHAESTVSSIVVEMPEIVDMSVEAGGTEITSYNLEFNNGAGS